MKELSWVSNPATDKSIKFRLSGSKITRTHNKADTQFLEDCATPVICIGNLQPAQSGRLLQSHTLMERCRGELLRQSRRKKKEMEHFPSCLNNPLRWVSKKRGRREVEQEKETERD